MALAAVCPRGVRQHGAARDAGHQQQRGLPDIMAVACVYIYIFLLRVPLTVTLGEASVGLPSVCALAFAKWWPTLSKASLSAQHLTLGEASFAEP
jgi:hypothetical protein